MPPADVTPLSSRRLTYAAMAEDELRAMVLAGRFSPGERINEVLLAETLGISRGPLREAIQRLASEGLLTVVTHKGAFVRTITAQELGNLYELRIAIETYAVRLATERATDAERAALKRLIERTAELLKDGNTNYPADLDIHLQIVAMSHNDALLRAIRDTHAKIHLGRARSAYDPVRANVACSEHATIVERILTHDAAGASDLLERHLRTSLQNALAHLQQP